MSPRETLREAVGLGVDDEIDVSLAMEGDILAAMAGDPLETHLFEKGPQFLGLGRGIFDELEAIGAHWVFEPEDGFFSNGRCHSILPR
jgi:hypothetical protein